NDHPRGRCRAKFQTDATSAIQGVVLIAAPCLNLTGCKSESAAPVGVGPGRLTVANIRSRMCRPGTRQSLEAPGDAALRARFQSLRAQSGGEHAVSLEPESLSRLSTRLRLLLRENDPRLLRPRHRTGLRGDYLRQA